MRISQARGLQAIGVKGRSVVGNVKLREVFEWD